VYKRKLKMVAESLTKGEPIHRPLKRITAKDPKLFSSMMITTIEIGEKTGRLEDVLDHLATYYEREVDNTMGNLSTIIEPVLLLVMGVMVAFIATSIIGPLYQMSEVI